MKKIIALVLALCLVLTAAAALAEKLTMGTNAQFPPYEYYEDGTIVEIVDMDFKAIISAVQTGKVDIGMAGMTVTDERKESVNFTESYATGIQAIIVKEDSAITSVDDLYADGADFQIGVQEGTTGDIYCSDDFGDDHVQKFVAGPDAVEALKAGKVDCVIIDNQPAQKFVEANEGLKILETSYTDEDYAIAVALDNTELLDKINAALAELIEDGTVEE